MKYIEFIAVFAIGFLAMFGLLALNGMPDADAMNPNAELNRAIILVVIAVAALAVAAWRKS